MYTDENCVPYFILPGNPNQVKTLLIRADLLREVILQINNSDEMWEQFKAAGLIKVVLSNGEIQTMFTKDHVHDLGATS